MNYLASHPAFNDTIDSLKNEFKDDKSNNVIICGAHDFSRTQPIDVYKKKFEYMKEEKHFCGTTCANPEVNGNKVDAAWKQVPMYKSSLWTRFIWWLKDKFGIV